MLARVGAGGRDRPGSQQSFRRGGAPSASAGTPGASREKFDLTPSPRLCDKGPEGTGTAPATLVARDAVRAIRSHPEVRGASTNSRSDGRLGDGAAQARGRPRLPDARGAEDLRVRLRGGGRILRRPWNPRADARPRRPPPPAPPRPAPPHSL